ncbi:uncharacterized protein N7529_007091 [Penicillium soppii]|uniref:uncharacterized protein n=1 Tax=Penicillium soppii TaxID=69789 RepID=UPI002548FB26|nr:uncharacterized protein N7529_007091 [Penicillium soppii]KAJ5865175.1 hypothetical protein N7529_007091 [Penicillium soppii]
MCSTNSIVHGLPYPIPPSCSIPQLLGQQVSLFSDREALVLFRGATRLTYRELDKRSHIVARSLLSLQIAKNDKVGIFMGNCETYAEMFLGIVRIGAVAVLLNGTYTAHEAIKALRVTVENDSSSKWLSESYNCFLLRADTVDYSQLMRAEKNTTKDSLCCFLLTSGTTGSPKVAMLSHNGPRDSVDRKRYYLLSFPLFHCGGLVLGLIACLSHGSCVVFPSTIFNATAVSQCLAAEGCTGIVGSPTMFSLVLKARNLGAQNLCPARLRTGLIGGSSYSKSLWHNIREEFGAENLVHAYGKWSLSHHRLDDAFD